MNYTNYKILILVTLLINIHQNYPMNRMLGYLVIASQNRSKLVNRTFTSQNKSLKKFSKEEEVRRLRLHFDINRTIIAIDSAQNKSLEETVNEILTEYTFARWDGVHEQSFYEYVSEIVANENPQLSRADETFKSKRIMLQKNFVQYVKDEPYLNEQYKQDTAKMLRALSTEHLVIFQSFFKAINWLNTHFPNRYTIYLRTFGEDLPLVIPIIEKETKLNFAIQGEFDDTKLSLMINRSDLYDFFTGNNQHFAIKDNYKYWKTKKFQPIGGKPFYVDKNNTNDISIFFDDKANNLDRRIIFPIGPNNIIESSQELLKTGNIVAVNPKEAILDEDYFIKKIEQILKTTKH